MVAVSSPAISRLSTATASSYSSIERMTRPLARENRWPSRSRRELWASDLASLLNVILGGQTSEAIEVDNMLRGLEYLSSFVFEPDPEQPGGRKLTTRHEPHLGVRNWGELLEGIIHGVPSPDPAERPVNAAVTDALVLDKPGTPILPTTIEVCLNPLSITLVWFWSGGELRRDFYQPTTLDQMKRASPYGPAVGLIRKTFLSSDVIITAGEILRDTSTQLTSPSAGPAFADAGKETAALPGRGSAAVLRDQPAETELDRSSQARPTGEREKSQSSSGLPAGRSRHRKQGDPNVE